jgi:hypothetical protein
MTLPGFNAETTLYRSSLAYWGVGAGGLGHRDNALAPAVLSFPDPCARFSGCAKARCYCSYGDGIWVTNFRIPPCFGHCLYE